MAVISGGGALEKKLAALAKNLTSATVLRVGFLEGSTEADGTSLPLVAAIQNFGAPSRGIPPRPFFSNMVAKEASGWGDDLAKILDHNGYDAKLSLEQMGDVIAGQLRQSIVDTNSPPLSPKTIKRKGFDKPLVDTGTMLNGIGTEVK